MAFPGWALHSVEWRKEKAVSAYCKCEFRLEMATLLAWRTRKVSRDKRAANAAATQIHQISAFKEGTCGPSLVYPLIFGQSRMRIVIRIGMPKQIKYIYCSLGGTTLLLRLSLCLGIYCSQTKVLSGFCDSCYDSNGFVSGCVAFWTILSHPSTILSRTRRPSREQRTYTSFRPWDEAKQCRCRLARLATDSSNI